MAGHSGVKVMSIGLQTPCNFLPNHQSIWECPTYTTGLDNPIMSTPGSHGALLGEYHSQITHPALLTEQKTGGTDGTLCLYSWEIIDPAKPTD